MGVKAREPRSLPDLSIATDKICFVIFKAREFDAKDVVTEPDPGSNPTDDGMLAVLEDHADDPVMIELAQFIHAMSEDEKADLVTMLWIGRGDGTLADWQELRAEAIRLHGRRTAAYLIRQPLLGELLEEALVMFGRSCDEYSPN